MKKVPPWLDQLLSVLICLTSAGALMAIAIGSYKIGYRHGRESGPAVLPARTGPITPEEISNRKH